MREDPERGLFCIDWEKEQIEIGGYYSEENYSRLEVVLVPCNYIHTFLGYQDDYVSSECVGDLEE